MINRNKKLLACCLIVIVLVVSGCGGKFDAPGYVRGVLDVTFQDETAQAQKNMEDMTEYELHKEHDERITRFVQNNITSEFDVTDQQQAQFDNLCEKIFSVMKYHVKDAKKTGKNEYEVAVVIQPSDVFIKFKEALVKDSERMAKALEAGEYQGSEEEIGQQILNDIMYNAYDLLSIAYMDMKYDKEETVVVKVEADDKNEYYVDEEEIDNIIIKILRLDEIQD